MCAGLRSPARRRGSRRSSQCRAGGLFRVDAAEAFGQATRREAGSCGNLSAPLTDALREAGWILHLRFVAEQSLDLRFDMIGDVDEMVEFGTGHHPYLGDGMRLEALVAQQFREGELVASVGIDRRQRRFAGGEVIRVAGVDAIEVANGRLAEHDVGLHLADHAAQTLAQFEIGNDATVGVPEEVQFGDAEDLRCGGLFDPADLGHAGAGDRVVETAGITVGDEAVDDVVARGHQAGDGAGSTEVEVVGMGGNGKDASSHFPKLTIWGHDDPMAIMSKSEREAFLAQPHVGVISIEADGRGPVTVPIWYSYESGGQVKVLTGVNSKKTQLLRAAGRFTLCVQRERLPYKYVSVEGPIVESRPAGIERDARPMAHRYLGPGLGDEYIEDGEGDSICFLMAPERWSSVDYGSSE